MTKLLLLSALLSIAASAQAAPSVLAKTITAGGMPGPDPKMCMSSEITIFSNGQVVTTKCGKSAVVQLTLGKEKTQLVTEFAKSSGGSSGKLEIEDPSKPECMDAPSTQISLMTAKGPLVIGGVINCRKQSLRWDDRMMHSEQMALNFIKSVNAVVNAPYSSEF